MKVPLTYSSPMDTVRIGYARCSIFRQDLTAQRSALVGLGVDGSYVDAPLVGKHDVERREWRAGPLIP